MRVLKLAAVALCAFAVPAQAGVLADDLSRCLLTKATDSDRGALMAWMFSAISSDPGLQKYTVLDRQKRDAIAKTAGTVFQRLVIVDCRSQAVAAIRAEGEEAMTKSFGALGQAATQQMFQSPEANLELESLDKGFDKEKLKELGREAGIRQDDKGK